MGRKQAIKLRARKPGERELQALEANIEARGRRVAGRAAAGVGQGTRQSPRMRSDGQAMRSTTVHLPVELAEKLAVHCAKTGKRQSAVIATLLEKHLR